MYDNDFIIVTVFVQSVFVQSTIYQKWKISPTLNVIFKRNENEKRL